jgi:hypothetical protein
MKRGYLLILVVGCGYPPLAAIKNLTGDDIAFFQTVPSGTASFTATGATPSGDQVFQIPIPVGSAGALGTLLGGAATGLWKLDVYDTVASGGPSTLESAKLTLHTTGGLDNIARTSQWA